MNKRAKKLAKNILMLLAGLNSTCFCSAMEDKVLKRLCEEEYQKKSDELFGFVDPCGHVRRTQEQQKKLDEMAGLVDPGKKNEEYQKKFEELFGFADFCRRHRTQDQQKQLDERFGLVDLSKKDEQSRLIDPCDKRVYVLLTKDQLKKIFEEKILPLRKYSYNKFKDIFLDDTALLERKKIIKKQLQYSSRFRFQYENRLYHSLIFNIFFNPNGRSHTTMVQKGAWNDAVGAWFWADYLIACRTPASICLSRSDTYHHVAIVTLVYDPESEKEPVKVIVLGSDDNFKLVAMTFSDWIKKCPGNFIPVFSSLPYYLLSIVLNKNFRLKLWHDGFPAPQENIKLKNEILDAIRRLASSTNMFGMSYCTKNNLLIVDQIELKDIKFDDKGKLNKDIECNSFISSVTIPELNKKFNTNSKWIDMRDKFFTPFRKVVYSADLDPKKKEVDYHKKFNESSPKSK